MPAPALRSTGGRKPGRLIEKLLKGGGKTPAPCLMSLILTTAGVVMTEFPGSFLIAHGAVRSAPESEDDVFCLRKAGNTFWYVVFILFSSMCLIFNDLRAGFYCNSHRNFSAFIPVTICYPVCYFVISILKCNSVSPEWYIFWRS